MNIIGLKETQDIYNNTDILYSVYSTDAVNSNNWNNAMPVKSFEAIITLTPIIASKGTVLGNFVEKNDIGYTVDGNTEDIINLFKRLINNPNMLEEKVENLKKIQYAYTWENVVTNLRNIYDIGEKHE